MITERDRKLARWNLMRQSNWQVGICETLRLAYDEVYQLPDSPQKEAIKERLAEAVVMGKKMAARLVYYQRTYSDTTGHQGKELSIQTGARDRGKMRKARPDR